MINKSNKYNTVIDNDDDLDFSEKNLSDFKNLKSLTISSKASDIKLSKIGEVYDIGQLHNKMHKICEQKIHNKSNKHIVYDKKISERLCTCLFEKNRDLTINELEERVLKHKSTPASECITMLDKYTNQYDKYKFGKSKKSAKSSKKSAKSSKKSAKSSKKSSKSSKKSAKSSKKSAKCKSSNSVSCK